MVKKKIEIMDTWFRDGFQSVYGARVLTKDFIPALKASVDAGVKHFEAGGGARFQSLYFYCNEDAFEMMDTFRATVGADVNLQTLARGVNVVGLESQSSDIIKLHAQLFKKHGITTIRNFDALNDVNNLIYSGKCITEAGLRHEVAVSMMELPPGGEGAHTAEFYAKVLKNILEAQIPFSSVCFKDASGTSTPKKVYETIKLARQILPANTHIRFHSHDTAGCGIMQYKAAIDAGADGLDLAMSPVSHGTCQPDIVTMWHALRGTEYEIEIDIDKVLLAEEIFKECMKDYLMPPESRAVEPLIPFSPMPGGALTANTQMMRDNGILDKYPEVIKNMKEVVEKGGYGTSVTPVSQFYFQQAYNNTMFKPWEKIADGYGKMVLGYFGKTPVEPDPEIVKIASEQLKLEPTTKTVLELNDSDPKKGVEVAKKLLLDNGITDLSEENIFIASTCKEKGITFLKGEAKVSVIYNQEVKTKLVKTKGGYMVKVNGKSYAVVIDGNKASINGKSYDFDVSEGAEIDTNQKNNLAEIASVKAPLPGVVLKINVAIGDSIEESMVIMVLEAMKMETEIRSSVVGTVKSINVKVGDQVAAGQELLTLG